MATEYGIAYANDMGGDEIEPGTGVEVTDDWNDDYTSHISEAGVYYRREDGGPWERVDPEPTDSEAHHA